MAILTLTNAFIKVNNVDLSDHCRSIDVKTSAQLKDGTAMGLDTLLNVAGLKEWSFDVEWNADWAAANVDATLFPLWGAAAFTVEIKAVNTTRSATNPSYSGSAVLGNYSPISGVKVGDMAISKTTFNCAGTLSRLTS
jgi:hypothetical protein